MYEQFKGDFIAKTSALQVGDPLDADTDVGAIVSKAHFDKIMSYMALAKAEGGTVLAGGEQAFLSGRCADGWFIQPTIVEGLPFDCRTNQEEVFGPFVTLMPFDTEEEVLGYANSVRYGLSSSIWTENLSRAHRVAAQIEAGFVWVNSWMLRDLRTLFGGYKDSGLGREGGFETLKFFTEEKNVCIKF
jgi:aminomuconate-semialdehyde/2-hydroxymuconate-6-semialdehyde dehydrogenase